MKKAICILGALLSLLPFCGSAQVHIKDDFEENIHLDWVEQSTKKMSALIQNGAIELVSKDKAVPAQIWVEELPVDIAGDFTVKAEVVVPKLTDKTYFGILFNRRDDPTNDSCYEYYIITMRQCYKTQSEQVKVENGDSFDFSEPTLRISRDWINKGLIKLSEGKDKKIPIEIKYVGGKLAIQVDGMEAFRKQRKELYSPAFGFWTPGDTSLRVTSVEVIQDSYTASE